MVGSASFPSVNTGGGGGPSVTPEIITPELITPPLETRIEQHSTNKKQECQQGKYKTDSDLPETKRKS